MFNALTPVASNESFCGTEYNTQSFRLALEALDDFTFLDQSFFQAQDCLAVHDRLVAFKSAVEKFGNTRSLMAFADYDGSLTRAFPMIPGVEALSATPMMLSDVALEKITTATEGLIGYVWSAVKHLVQRYRTFFKWMALIISGIQFSYTSFLNVVSRGAYSRVYFMQTGRNLLGFSAYGQCLEYAKSLSAAIGTATSVKLPFTEKEYQNYVKEITEIFKERGGITIKDEADDKTLAEHGYTKENVVDLYRTTESDAKHLLSNESTYISRLESLSKSQAADTLWGKKGFVFLSRHVSLTFEEVKKLFSKMSHTLTAINTEVEAHKNKDNHAG